MAVTKDQIADVFEKHVERFGYQKTTVDDVAGELGISKKTVYVHFDSKRDVYAYVVARIAKQSRREMAASIADLPTTKAKLLGLARMVMVMGRSHIVETSKSEWMQQYEVAADAFTEATGSLMESLLEQGVADSELAVRDVGLARRMLTAMILEYTMMLRDDPTYDCDDELLEGIGRYLG